MKPITMSEEQEASHRMTVDTLRLDAEPVYVHEASEAFEKEIDALRARLAEVERALAASQAECAKLREALAPDECDVTMDGEHEPGCRACANRAAAISAPSDDSALREVCEKVAECVREACSKCVACDVPHPAYHMPTIYAACDYIRALDLSAIIARVLEGGSK